MATDPKKLFNNLAAGDAISIRGMKSEFLVLKTRGENGKWKHFGQICGCGNHVHGIPHLFRWDDEKGMPVDKSGRVLDIWLDPQVDKDVQGALAKKFEGLAINDDKSSSEEMERILKENPKFLKAIEVGYYSHADLGVTVVAMIRALGGTLDDEQAVLVAATAETHATSLHMSSLSALLGTLSGLQN